MSAYTDDDVKAGLSVRREDCEHEKQWASFGVFEICDEHSLRAALDAIAPAIAARAKAEAFREAAALVRRRVTPGNANVGPRGRQLERQAIATMLREHANEEAK